MTVLDAACDLAEVDPATERFPEVVTITDTTEFVGSPKDSSRRRSLRGSPTTAPEGSSKNVPIPIDWMVASIPASSAGSVRSSSSRFDDRSVTGWRWAPDLPVGWRCGADGAPPSAW